MNQELEEEKRAFLLNVQLTFRGHAVVPLTDSLLAAYSLRHDNFYSCVYSLRNDGVLRPTQRSNEGAHLLEMVLTAFVVDYDVVVVVVKKFGVCCC